MEFRHFLVLSSLIHLIIIFLLFLIPDKEKEKKENPPIFIDLIEPKAPAAPLKATPSPVKSLPKPSVKKLEPPKPFQPVHPTEEDKSAVPEKLEGGLIKKTVGKQPVQELKEPETKKAASKVNAEKPEKTLSSPKLQPKKKRAPTRKPSKPVTQVKKEPVSKKIQPSKKARQDIKLSKSEKKGWNRPVLKEKPRPTGDTPTSEKSKGADSSDIWQKDAKKRKVNLFDRDILQKHANQDYASAKSYKNSGPSDRSKSSDHGVITLDTTDIRYVGYMSKLKQRIEYIWRYPPAAVRAGLYGDLYIRFTIMQNGSMSKVELVRTSGHQELDKAAIRALKEGSPYWPFPKSWGKKSISITGHFIYTLGGRYGVY